MATSSADVRDRLVRALEADLVGPFDLDAGSQEVLPLPPSRWYLTGFLVPQTRREVEDPTEDDELGAGEDDDDDTPTEPEVKRRSLLPASIGMSVLLPPGSSTDKVRVRLRYADYVRQPPPEPVEGEDKARPR